MTSRVPDWSLLAARPKRVAALWRRANSLICMVDVQNLHVEGYQFRIGRTEDKLRKGSLSSADQGLPTRSTLLFPASRFKQRHSAHGLGQELREATSPWHMLIGTTSSVIFKATRAAVTLRP